MFATACVISGKIFYFWISTHIAGGVEKILIPIYMECQGPVNLLLE